MWSSAAIGVKLLETVEELSKKLFCPNCGQENPPGSRFCQNCGVDMSAFAASPPPVSAAIPTPAPVKKRMPGWMWGVLGVLVVILVGVSVLFFNRSEPLPLEQPAAQATQAVDASCEDKLAFVTDVTVPDGTVLSPNEIFTKTWRLRNIGACTWTTSYQLAFKDGQQMLAPETIALTKDVSPHQEVDISIDFTVPSDPGSYKSFWRLQNADGVIVPIEGVSDNSIFVNVHVESQDNGVLLYDDFNDETSGWPVFGDEKGEVGYRDGDFRIAFYKPMGFHAAWSQQEYSDSIVETVFSTPADIPDVGAGLTLRAKETGWYLLWIYPAQGKYLFQKDMSGQVTELVPLAESPVIRPLEQEGRLYLQLKVEARGDKFDIWIGQPDSVYGYLDSISDSDLTTGHLGPSADCPDGAFDSPIEVLFEWIKISE